MTANEVRESFKKFFQGSAFIYASFVPTGIYSFILAY